MATVYRLVGYDRNTEFLAAAYDIPSGLVPAARRSAGVATKTAEMLGDWPLSDAQAREIATLIGQAIDLHRMEFFLEPYVFPEEPEGHSKGARAG